MISLKASRPKALKIAQSFKISAAVGLSLALLGAGSAMALDRFNSTVDKRTPTTDAQKKNTRTLLDMRAADFKKLAVKKKVVVDIKVLLDGKTKYAVLQSEDGDPQRYNVDCYAGAYGRLPMGEGIEYYLQTGDVNKKKISLSVYPGSRSSNPDNDVSCVADAARPKSAVLRIRGIYRVMTNDFGDRLIVELRPLKREDLTPAERKGL